MIANLKKKNVVYVKADKSNNIVIINKNDYDERVLNLINECKYKQVNRNPLKKMIREVDEMRRRIKSVFSDRVCRKLIVSNPTLPKLYALPKTHKEGKKMRPIVSNVNAPSYKLAKWLVNEFKKLPKLDSLSVKNSFDFVGRIKNLKLNENEVILSFDVSSLFPNIPVDISLMEIEKYLYGIDLDSDKKSCYLETARLCMKQGFFLFREKIYAVEFGTNMGNPLSPMIAEFFMAAFETKLRDENVLPRIWHRYVDDVFAIVHKNDIQKTLDLLNSLTVFSTLRDEMWGYV